MSDREAIKRAYGLLWLDGEPSMNGLKFEARKVLLACLSREEKIEAVHQATEIAGDLRKSASRKLPDLSNAFVENEAPEERFARDAEIACPACGGSGHKANIHPVECMEKS